MLVTYRGRRYQVVENSFINPATQYRLIPEHACTSRTYGFNALKADCKAV